MNITAEIGDACVTPFDCITNAHDLYFIFIVVFVANSPITTFQKGVLLEI